MGGEVSAQSCHYSPMGERWDVHNSDSSPMGERGMCTTVLTSHVTLGVYYSLLLLPLGVYYSPPCYPGCDTLTVDNPGVITSPLITRVWYSSLLLYPGVVLLLPALYPGWVIPTVCYSRDGLFSP